MGSHQESQFYDAIESQVYVALPQQPGLTLEIADDLLQKLGFSSYNSTFREWSRKRDEVTDVISFIDRKMYHPSSKIYEISASCSPFSPGSLESLTQELERVGCTIVKRLGEKPETEGSVYEFG